MSKILTALRIIQAQSRILPQPAMALIVVALPRQAGYEVRDIPAGAQSPYDILPTRSLGRQVPVANNNNTLMTRLFFVPSTTYSIQNHFSCSDSVPISPPLSTILLCFSTCAICHLTLPPPSSPHAMLNCDDTVALKVLLIS